MEIRRDVLRACAGWETVGSIRDLTGATRAQVRSAKDFLLRRGFLESRFADGVGYQYHATGRPYPERRSCQIAVLKALAEGPATVGELMAKTGHPRQSVQDALRALASRGETESEGFRPREWRLARCPAWRTA